MAGGEQRAAGRRVVLAGGGTGGHVYPALAMADALAALGHSVTYMGDADRLEGRVVPLRGLPFVPLKAPQFPRAGLLAKLRFGFALLGAIARARAALVAARAEVVVGVGGYISAPPVLAAWTLGLPTAVHEANVTPGLANRLCARVADLVLLTYAETAARLPGRAPREVVGCPVNPKVLEGDAAAARARYGLGGARPVVVVVGGSLGAATLNALGLALLRLRRGQAQPRFDLVLVTGPTYEAATRAEAGALDEGVAIVGYEDRMADAYAAAAVVVCRAGSSTLAELCAVGLPSVLVPSPNVTDNHQEGNARGLERAGAARVVLERGMNPDQVAAEVDALVADPAALTAMGQAARGLARLDTAAQVGRLVDGLLRR
jgi:UDP-N-acetylglucosamine--N-acetylmuramyl-(pentapeptide) pyrophosphoryl-undecaprenol N-acetylglucosamine transferase